MMDLLRFMLCSQSSFVEKRLVDPKYAKAFKEVSLRIINLTADNNTDIELFKLQLSLIKAHIQDEKPGYVVSIFNDNYKYKILAVELAEDIVSSIETRFINGGSKAYLELLPKSDFIC
jgi:hypothetical protein